MPLATFIAGLPLDAYDSSDGIPRQKVLRIAEAAPKI